MCDLDGVYVPLFACQVIVIVGTGLFYAVPCTCDGLPLASLLTCVGRSF